MPLSKGLEMASLWRSQGPQGGTGPGDRKANKAPPHVTSRNCVCSALQKPEGICRNKTSAAELTRVRQDWAEDARTHLNSSKPRRKQPNLTELTPPKWPGPRPLGRSGRSRDRISGLRASEAGYFLVAALPKVAIPPPAPGFSLHALSF